MRAVEIAGARHLALDRFQLLGVNEDLLHEISIGMEPEDGVIWVYGIGEDGIMAFTDEGVEEVRLILEEYKRVPSPKT